MARLCSWRRMVAAGLLGWALLPPAGAQMALPATPQMQRLPGAAGTAAAQQAMPAGAGMVQQVTTVQGQIDQQRQLNERMRATLKTVTAGLDQFRKSPLGNDRRDYCLDDFSSFDRLNGLVHACEGTRCPTTSQNSRDGSSTCDPARRGPPNCNSSDWCQGGYVCATTPAPGVCIRSDCAANMKRDDCQPRIDRVHRGAWK